MSHYRCSCGFRAELTPRLGDAIVSVIHLHRAARIDGSSVPERMVQTLQPVKPDLQIAMASAPE